MQLHKNDVMSEIDPFLSGSNVPPVVEPIKFVTQSGLARELGLSKQRITQLRQEGGLPPPDGILDENTLIWSTVTAAKFRDRRASRYGKASTE